MEVFVPVLKKAFESGTEDGLVDMWTQWAEKKRKEVEQTCLEHHQVFDLCLKKYFIYVRDSLILLINF